MKRILALFTVLALAVPAQAHFIWLAPQKNGSVQMVFSDSLEPDANVPITKIAQAQVFARDAKGTLDVKKTEAKDHYLLEASSKLDGHEVGGVCVYGVLAKKGDPYLLNYYAKTSIGRRAKADKVPAGWSKLPLEILELAPGKFVVHYQGKPASEVELIALLPGDESRELTQKKDGSFDLGKVPAAGWIGMRARYIEKKEGELKGAKYKEIKHYSTWTFEVGNAKPVSLPVVFQGDAKADPAATKLLADARAARAVWKDFPGFTSDLDINVNGKVAKGKLDVASTGKVNLTVEAGEDAKAWARREISSLVSHRLPGGSLDTPCAFIDTNDAHPSGRAIRVLNDELHSSYRIRDRQIMEVNRAMKDTRFTITVLENKWNKEKQYLPVSYVVSTWDLKSNTLVSSSAHHDTWTRIGSFDLPVTVRVVNAKAGQLDNRLLTFSNLQLVK